MDQLVQVELILGVAEVADDLAVGVLVTELFQLLFAEAEQHLFGALVAAIALVCDIPLVEDVGFKALQRQLHHVLRRLARAEHFSDGGHGGNVLFQLGDLSIGGTRQQLDEIAACAGDGQVFIDQNPQRTDGGHLLTVSIVAGQVFGDLTRDKRHLADGRFFLQAVIPDDGQHTVPADGTADIQMAVFFERKLHQRIVDAALHVAGAIGAGDEDARRAAARNAQGDGVPVILEHGAHQGGPRQQTAKGGAAGRTGLVELFGLADDCGRVHTAEDDTAVFRQAADQIRHIIVPPIGYTA